MATAGGSAAAGPRVIDVHPGKDAISKAIAKANAGDTLRIHPGTYQEAPTVDKPLTLEATPHGPRPVIDAGCAANDAIHVTSRGVTIWRLTVKGAASGFGDYPAEIFFENTPTGTVSENRVIDSCDAEYGVSAFNTGPVDVAGNYARGFDDSGIYIGSIANTRGKVLRVVANDATRNSRGIIVEDSNLRSDRIRVAGNILDANRIAGGEGPSDGLFLANSDRVKVVGNTAIDNAGSGYHPNASSDHNVFRANTATHNDAGKLLDEGHGNCGSGNNFPLPAC